MSNSTTLTQRAAHRLRGFAGTVLDVLLAQDCALCGRSSGAETVCAACLGDLPRHGPGSCPRCGDVCAGGEVCGQCLQNPPHFDATFAAFTYAFPVDRLVHRFKYAGQLHLARWWATHIAEALPATPFDLILPMPLHPSRLRQRGFNQAAEIGRHLAHRLGVPMQAETCVRSRATPPQAELERDKRVRNVRGAFECRRDLGNRHVLLLDDVMTTGASMNELARVVKLHGASSVTAVIAARTLHH